MISLAFFVPLLMPHIVHAQSLTPEQRAQLQNELRDVEAQAAIAQQQLNTAQTQSASLSRDITVLTARIKTAQLNIKAKNLLIQTLGNDINLKERHIDDLESHINKGKQSLSDILRKMNELDQNSVPEVLLSQSSVAGFFKDIDSFQSIQDSLQDTFDHLQADQASTTAERNALDLRRNKEVDARYAIQQQEAEIKRDEGQKKQLLSISKGNEKAYTTLVAQKQARAAQIRSALFALRDSAAIPFGQALQYANFASQKTGVRPAFILAILTQESALGANVGTCYLTDQSTGAGVSSRSGNALSRVMSPTRDVPPFLSITRALGIDYTKQVVSCPQSIGWGGAMGPAQFIASTWVLLEDRIQAAFGISTVPDPWNPQHAFMASAMYLADLGAAAGGYTAERTAACKYYSGRSCGAVSGNTSYGNSVIAKANNIQTNMIDPLRGL